MVQEAQAKQPDEMFCSSCGAVIKKEAESCAHCGATTPPPKVQAAEAAPLRGRVVRPRFWWFGRLQGSCPVCGQRVRLDHSCPQQIRCEACGAQLVLRSGPIQAGSLLTNLVVGGPTLYSKEAVEARWTSPGRPSSRTPLLSLLRWLLSSSILGYLIGIGKTGPAGQRQGDVTLSLVTVGAARYEEKPYVKTTTRMVTMKWGHTCCACFERHATHFEEEGRDASGIRRVAPGGLRTISFSGVPYCDACYRKAYKSAARFLLILFYPVFFVAYFLVGTYLLERHLLSRARGVLVRDYDFGCDHWVRLFFKNRDYARWFVEANKERLIWAM